MRKLLMCFTWWLTIGFSQGQQLVALSKSGEGSFYLNVGKILAIGTRDGLVFEGKARLKNGLLEINGQQLTAAEVGFIEVKKFRPEKAAAFPFKLVGGVSAVVGALLLVTEDEDDPELARGASGIGLLAGGVLLFYVGKKIAPQYSGAARLFHIKDWEFDMR